MPEPRVEVRGADRLARTLRSTADGLANNLGPEQASGASRLATSARRRAPRRTGALASSITEFSTGSVLGIESRLPYAGVHEWGWPARHIPARHYAGQAYEETRGSIVEGVLGGVRRLLAQVRGA